MRIEETYRPAIRTTSRARSGTTAFLVPAAGDEPPAVSVAASGATPVLEPAAERSPGPAPAPLSDQAAASQGSALLDALSGLQAGALGGDDGPALEALAGLAQSDGRAACAGMQGILDAIGARVAVELERRGSAAPLPHLIAASP